MIDENALPERRLMQAVILNAIADASGRGNGSRRPMQAAADRRIALRWFIDAGPDYQRICEFAGLHPETVRKYALAFIASGKPLPRMYRNAVHKSAPRTSPNPLSPTAIAIHAGVSVSAVRNVLKHNKGSAELKERVLESLRTLTEQHRLAA